MSYTALAAAGALFLLGACAHERREQRDGCWIKKNESRLGDTREEIAACVPKAPSWSPDPLVRAIEDCLYQEQVARYQDNVRPKKEGGVRPMERCLEHAQKLALERIDGLQRQIAAADDRAKRLNEENAELRKTILACVEKSPQAIAEARATTDSSSDANTTHTAEKVDRRSRKDKRTTTTSTPAPTATTSSMPGSPPAPGLPAPSVTQTSGGPGCIQDAKATSTTPAPKIR
jgi:hypothetical protein